MKLLWKPVPRMPLKAFAVLAFLVSGIVGIVSAPDARADGLLAFSALPFSSGSADYPTAFSGFGYGVGFSYQAPGTPYAGTIRMISQGDGSIYGLLFRYYLKGKIWPVTPDPTRQDLELQLRPRRLHRYP
jgi:hypothetical protein